VRRASQSVPIGMPSYCQYDCRLFVHKHVQQTQQTSSYYQLIVGYIGQVAYISCIIRTGTNSTISTTLYRNMGEMGQRRQRFVTIRFGEVRWNENFYLLLRLLCFFLRNLHNIFLTWRDPCIVQTDYLLWSTF
jgi:hypothetical protein